MLWRFSLIEKAAKKKRKHRPRFQRCCVGGIFFSKKLCNGKKNNLTNFVE